MLLIPTVVAHRAGKHAAESRAQPHCGGRGDRVHGVVARLVDSPPAAASSILREELLRAAAALWVSNILVFASWYWRLDAGGPNARDQRDAHDEGAFLFPQMITPWESDKNWRPGFVDYLFLAFNTSTAFSPTDVPVLSRWAKLMMMVQA